MPHAIYIALIPLLPLAGFLMLGIFGRKHFNRYSGMVGSFFLFISTALSLYTAWSYFFQSGKVNGVYQKLIVFNYEWLNFPATFFTNQAEHHLSINMGIILDPISVMMLVVITFISLMVHIYSLGYMKGEERFSTYYAFLGLFTFSMLGLVMSANIFQMYIFWELVGVSSFLLIGFYFDRPKAVAACKKAFIVTRFADLGFLIGILTLSYYSGSFDLNTLIQRPTSPGSVELFRATNSSFLGISALAWGLLLVFIGGAGKSAMFPLHVWLPDAMEGPTPVSALIHAATMVVAGVFLVARLFPVFAISSPSSLMLVGYVGIFSALFAAIIACTQTDIKRVLAYSTMSQIGFMMLGLGVAEYGGEESLGYTASMFHLFTHAMFKALLFLCAGTVIHFIHSNEMKDMGGLRKYLPVTHIVFLIGCLAIAGIPPFAGFFSKEEILFAAYQHNQTFYWIALITSGLTAFYMFRLYFSIFWRNNGPAVFQKHDAQSTSQNEGGFSMIVPLILLAAGAAFAGFIPFGEFVSSDGSLLGNHFHFNFSIAPVACALIGISTAAWLYKNENHKADKIASSINAIYKAAHHKFYIDELYLFITKRIIFNGIGKPAAWFDKHVVDGLMNASGFTTMAISNTIKGMQSGKVQQYAIYFLVSLMGLAVLFIYVWS